VPTATPAAAAFDFKPDDTNGVFEPSGEHRGAIAARRIRQSTHGAVDRNAWRD
jgi:hypothetical protein